jgi:transcriptional regulator with XRE-family HTH domain
LSARRCWIADKLGGPDLVTTEKFGALVRREREARKIGLRELAKKIGTSPTYLSMIERDEFAAPVEEKVRAIARILGRDPDELLGLANRVSADLTDIIKERPRVTADLLRTIRRLSTEQVERLAEEAKKVEVVQ